MEMHATFTFEFRNVEGYTLLTAYCQIGCIRLGI
jgi:hypothetical protein